MSDVVIFTILMLIVVFGIDLLISITNKKGDK